MAQPIANYFATDTTPTVEELRAVIEGLDGIIGDLTFSSAVSNAGIFGATGQTELRYDVVFDFQWTRQLGLDLRGRRQ